MLISGRSKYLRIAGMGAVFVLLFGVLVGRAAYLSLGQKNQDRINLVLMTRTPASLANLEEQSLRLAEVSRKIDRYSLAEIRQLLDKTSGVANRAAKEIQAQQDAWQYVQTRSRVDAETYRRIQSDLNMVTRMQEDEISRLTKLLKRAEEQPLSATIPAFLATYLLGILSSLLSSYLYDLWKERKKRSRGGAEDAP